MAEGLIQLVPPHASRSPIIAIVAVFPPPTDPRPADVCGQIVLREDESLTVLGHEPTCRAALARLVRVAAPVSAAAPCTRAHHCAVDGPCNGHPRP